LLPFGASISHWYDKCGFKSGLGKRLSPTKDYKNVRNNCVLAANRFTLRRFAAQLKNEVKQIAQRR
jgi:hypothetical protein